MGMHRYFRDDKSPDEIDLTFLCLNKSWYFQRQFKNSNKENIFMADQ